MIRSVATYLASVPPVFTDGLLYALVAMLAFLQTQLGTDDAAKFVSPTTLWWSKLTVGTFGAGALAIKLFRSTAFADHQQQKKIDTQFLTRSVP